MDAIRRFSRPVLRRPVALVAFEGWSDACDAASGVLSYIIGQHDDLEPFAAIEPEEFFDFQEHRPRVTIDDGGTRSLFWPETKFYALQREDRDLVLVLGEEPSFRWKTYSRLITQILHETDVEDVILLGAFIGQVPHTRPVPVIAVATDPSRVADTGLMTSSYEGPTGITGVMIEACREAGLPALSLWAATPHYLAANPNPKAMLALLRAAESAWDIRLDDAELATVASEFETRVDAAMQRSEEFAGYVNELEAASTDDDVDQSLSNQLVTEIEAFLKEQG